MTARSQLVLELGHATRFRRADFVVSDSNADAAAWVDRWPHWPKGLAGVNLFGPSGCGKSHLGAVWTERAGAAAADRSLIRELAPPTVLGGRRNLLIDDLDDAWPGLQVLHLYNMVMERGGAVLVLSRSPCASLSLRPPDLVSRLATLVGAAVGLPDDRLLLSVMAKMFDDRQIRVDHATLGYLVSRMRRSFGEAVRLVDELDRASLAAQRSVTLSLARQVLGDSTDTETIPGG